MTFALDQIWIHRYELRRRGGGAVEGALVRWGDGVGCLQPWPEFGTATLETELAGLRRGEPLLLGRRALDMASLDGVSRAYRTSLWDEVSLPWCHRLVLPGEEPSEAGWRPVKVKVREDLEPLSEWLAWGVACELPVRADANGHDRTASDWLRWWRSLDEERRRMLEFIEDPLPREDIAGWLELAGAGLPLAWDWEKPPSVGTLRPWTAGIFKPGYRAALPVAAGNAAEMTRRSPQLVVTGMLGHPLGELHAAWVAGRWSRPGSTPASWRMARWHGVSGWETLEDAETWIELLGPDERGRLKKPQGYGLGLTDQLNKLMWQRLV